MYLFLCCWIGRYVSLTALEFTVNCRRTKTITRFFMAWEFVKQIACFVSFCFGGVLG